jgi:subtilisin-like proprotein convertase family protein
MRQFLILLGCLLAFVRVDAQAFKGVGGPINDEGKITTYTIKVSGLPTKIDGKFGLEQVCIDVVHTWDNDLEIFLVAPDGSTSNLALRNGEGDDNYTNTCFTDSAGLEIGEGDAPFTGEYNPETPIGCVNNGQNPNGTWKLVVNDNYPHEEQGKLVSWTLRFGKKPSQKFEFNESRLPILVINTKGQPILNETKVQAEFGIIDNGSNKVNKLTDKWNAFKGYAGIESRGNSTQKHPKLGYGLELRDSAAQNVKESLFGMAKSSDYVLVANYSDKSLIRNDLAYLLYRQMGNYAPRMANVSVVLNGQYLGIYNFGEKIKQGKSQVDISTLDPDDNAGDSLTGGYIIKSDWEKGSNTEGWKSKYPAMRAEEVFSWQFHYPNQKKLTPAQKTYIQGFVDSLETACIQQNTDPKSGYPHFIDVKSWIDDMLMIELGKNVDGYWRSAYYYKEKDSKGGKLHAGPIWDYDISFGNFEYDDGYYPGAWHWEDYGVSSDKTPQFWFQLALEPQFQNQMKCRWVELRKNVLSIPHIMSAIDSISGSLMGEQDLNFKLWPILGKEIWPNADPIEVDYAGEIRRLKEWFVMRIAWMDYFMPGTCK